MSDFYSTDLNYALKCDLNDPLAHFRQRFYMPADTIYLDGNSLGLLSADAENSVLNVLNEWKNMGIKGWLDGKTPWFYLAEEMGWLAAPLVGADKNELIFTGTTTVNLHALLSTFYKPEGSKTKILADTLNFPSDIYALKGQIKSHGLNPDNELILAQSPDGYTLSEQTIVDLMTDDVALVLLPSVLFSSGQLLDMAYLTHEAHKRNIIIGFDCSHSAGAVPHHLTKWGVDFAVFCSYKYLNGGPGSTAFLYLNKKHFQKEPLLAGWFGYAKERQFDMSLHFEHAQSAGGWQISAPAILGSASIEGSLKLMNEAGIEAIRAKSLKLTDYLLFLSHQWLCNEECGFRIVTPTEHERRGGHISLVHKTDSFRICEALKAEGIIPDFRLPDIIRIAPVALYNTFEEVWRTVSRLREIALSETYLKYSNQKRGIT